MRGWIYGAVLAAWLAGCQKTEAPGVVTQTATPSATPSATPTATRTPKPVSQGNLYLKEARELYRQKKYGEAAIRADLAGDLLKCENAPARQRTEAHSLAARAYTQRRDSKKALRHFRALKALNPKNRDYARQAAALAAAQPGPSTGPQGLSEAQEAHRREGRLSRLVPVRITSPFDPMGHIEYMTERDYLARKANGGGVNY